MPIRKPRIGQELLDVPMGDMIREMAFAIAEGQMALDANSIDVAEMMGGLKTITDDEGNVAFQDSRVFFGKETITISEAVDRLNSGTDAASAASIIKKANPTTIPVATPPTITGGGTVDYAVSATDEAKTITIPQRMSMMELGFTPTFYQFVDTIIEVKIAIKYTSESSSAVSISHSTTSSSSAGVGGGIAKFFGSPNKKKRSVSTSQVNASYSQKFSYSAEGSSLLRTKLVPIPPPAVLEDRIRKMMEAEFDNAAPVV
jgi:hypothetical protein